MSIQCGIVYGALRSGTTMLRLMLDAHPDLACIDETDFLVDHLHLASDGTWRYDWDSLRADRIFQASGVSVPDACDGPVALAEMIRQIGALGGGRPILMLHRHLDKIAALLPAVPILHVVRDPRDVARSSIGMGWEGNVYHSIGHWIETERAWQTHGCRLKNPVETMTYEALVSDATSQLPLIAAHFGAQFDAAMLGYAETSTYEPPDPKLAFQWRTKLSKHDIQLVEARVGDLLSAVGYLPSGHPPLHIGPLRKAGLAMQTFAFRWRHLISTYGMWPIHRGVGRRLRIKTLERIAQQKMDSITVRLLR